MFTGRVIVKFLLCCIIDNGFCLRKNSFSCQIVRLYLLSSPAAPSTPPLLVVCVPILGWINILNVFSFFSGIDLKEALGQMWIVRKLTPSVVFNQSRQKSLKSNEVKKFQWITDPSLLCTAVLTLFEFCCCSYSNAVPPTVSVKLLGPVVDRFIMVEEKVIGPSAVLFPLLLPNNVDLN